MKFRTLLSACAVLLAVSGSLWAQKIESTNAPTAGTITDGAADFEYNDFGADSPGADLRHSGVDGDGDQLWEYGWFFRIEGAGSETSFNAPTTETYVGDTATLVWNGLGGGAFDAHERTVITDTGASAATVNTGLTIVNTSGGTLVLNLFHYTDIDANATFGTDTAVLTTNPSLITVSDSGTNIQYRALNNNSYQVTAFTTLEDLLTDGGVTDLNNTGLPFGPGDFTGAFQWVEISIPSGGTAGIGVSLGLNTDAPVPTPPDVEPPIGDPGQSIARFVTNKFFNDGNPGDVDVQITCNTGLPLTQPATISEGDGVTFVVTDFEDGELNCEIVETDGQDGYSQAYQSDGQDTGDSCVFTAVAWEDVHTCDIFNDLDQVRVEVTKWWMDENPEFNAVNYAEANYSCVNEVFVQVSGSLDFIGDGDTNGFLVYPDWDGSTTCAVTETVVDTGVEFDDSECASLSVTPGNGATCNIYNTRLYEGIPTLSQYGLALMALLMLGVGFVAFRRYS